MKKKFDKQGEADGIRVRFILQPEYDSYEEWFQGEIRTSMYDLADDKELKYALEDVFQRREEITLEELKKYIDNIYKPSRKDIIISLLVLYQDIYQNEEDYDKKLVDDTIKYFNFSDKALAWARMKVPYEEVQKELENDIPIKNKTN